MLDGRSKTAARDLQAKTNVLTVKIEELKVKFLNQFFVACIDKQFRACSYFCPNKNFSVKTIFQLSAMLLPYCSAI